LSHNKDREVFVISKLCQTFFQNFFFVPGDKGDPEPPFFFVEVGSAVAGELDRGSHFLEDLKIIIEAAFGDADLVGAVGRSAGGFEGNQVVKTDEAME